MGTKKKRTDARGGFREGAGRKPNADVAATAMINIRGTPEQKMKFHAIGGAEWFRRALARAKWPTE